jgi:hypothetical protein
VDRFASQEAWQRFHTEHRTDYAELDSRCAALTRSEIDVLG